MLTPQLSAPLRPPAPPVPEAIPIPKVSPRWAPAACDILAVLVAAAGRLDLHDTGAVARLREAAHRITAQLAALGGLPAHLVVDPDDPDVVVVRTLAAAWRRAVPASGEQSMSLDASRETSAGRDQTRTASPFDSLYDELVAAWHMRFAVHEADRALADRVAAEERYRAARAAIRAWLEEEAGGPPMAVDRRRRATRGIRRVPLASFNKKPASLGDRRQDQPAGRRRARPQRAHRPPAAPEDLHQARPLLRAAAAYAYDTTSLSWGI